MICWLWNIIVGRGGCAHVWLVESSYAVTRNSDGATVYIDKHLHCTKCGDWKKVRL